MFLSGAVMATLYFGGYDIPFVNDANLVHSIGVNWLAVLEGAVFIIKILWFYFPFHVGKMDRATFQVRSINEPGLENTVTIGAF